MVPIPHGIPISHYVPAPLVPYGPALLALAASMAAAWFGRAKGQAWRRTAMSLACLLGWAALEPVARLRGVALSPSVGAGMLIVPAAALAVIEALRVWRGGRNERWFSVAAALVTGWWLGRVAAGPGEFWRVCFVVTALVWVVAWAVRGQTMRGAAVALALWGGAVVAGFPIGWVVASAVLAAVWAGLLALGAEAAVPSALVAAAVAGADLARGRIPRGHVDAADLVCLLALAAPFLAAAAEKRLATRWRMLAPALGAAGAVALGWGLRRAVF
jgi:hypothetical protein